MGSPDVDPATFANLEKQQSLFVRLLFDERIAAAYGEAPEAFLIREGLDPGLAAILPDVTSDGFKAEIRARRGLVLGEIENSFPQTRDLLSKLVADDPLAVGQFMGSAAFLDPRAGLPHPSGVGLGYDFASKFFSGFALTKGLWPPARTST